MKYLSLAYAHPENLKVWTNPEKNKRYLVWMMYWSEGNIAG